MIKVTHLWTTELLFSSKKKYYIASHARMIIRLLKSLFRI